MPRTYDNKEQPTARTPSISATMLGACVGPVGRIVCFRASMCIVFQQQCLGMCIVYFSCFQQQCLGHVWGLYGVSSSADIDEQQLCDDPQRPPPTRLHPSLHFTRSPPHPYHHTHTHMRVHIYPKQRYAQMHQHVVSHTLTYVNLLSVFSVPFAIELFPCRAWGR